MTRLRLYLKNSARAAQNSLVLLVLAFLAFGCSASTSPTFIQENIEDAVQNITKNEYKVDIKAKLVGQTLWIYIPLEDIITKADKPEKFTERYAIEQNKAELKDGLLKIDYSIHAIPEKEKLQEVKYNKAAIDKINGVWKVLRRVLFSMGRLNKEKPQFFSLVTADIKNGIEIKEVFYYEDLKKASYELISMGEYQHRTPQDMDIAPQVIGNKDGSYLEYRDITMGEFIARQIQHRIRLKFQKPEVKSNADVDTEVLKIATHTLKIYGFGDFTDAQLNNLLTGAKIFFNKAALLEKVSQLKP